MSDLDDDQLIQLTRRALIQRLTFLGGGVVLLGGGGGVACKKEETPAAPKAALTSRHRTFTNAEYDSMAAACERILPRDQDPGALDANVPEYVDRMLQAPELSQQREQFLAGLSALDRRAGRLHPGKTFAQIPPQDQDALLSDFKDAPPRSGEARFYDLLMVLTLEGFLGDPSYGGNKDRVGWALVGFGTSEPADGYDGQHHLHHLKGQGHDAHGHGAHQGHQK